LSTLLLVPLEDVVVFPNMTVTLSVDVGEEAICEHEKPRPGADSRMVADTRRHQNRGGVMQEIATSVSSPMLRKA